MLLLFLSFIFLSGFVLLVWTYFESKRRQINRYSVSLKNKKLLRSFRILHLSDIHFSGNDRSLSRFFDRLAGEAYDFVFITGDIFDCEAGIPAAVENLKKLKASRGMFGVFGNHDYYDYQFLDIATMGFRGRNHPDTHQPVKKFIKALGEAGVTVLMNEHVEIREGNQKIVIYGLDDPTTGRADIEKAMQYYDPANINILMTHTLDAFFYIGEDEIDLSFSGHSHGGQIRFPWIGAVITHTQFGPNYVQGIKEVKGSVCSISRGVGGSRYFSLRLLCLPEALILDVEGRAS